MMTDKPDWFPDGSKLYVYEFPQNLTNGYCFGGGHPITFKNIDWFDGFPNITKEDVQREIQTKDYCRIGQKYLVIHSAHTLTFSFYAEKNNRE